MLRVLERVVFVDQLHGLILQVLGVLTELCGGHWLAGQLVARELLGFTSETYGTLLAGKVVYGGAVAQIVRSCYVRVNVRGVC